MIHPLTYLICRGDPEEEAYARCIRAHALSLHPQTPVEVKCQRSMLHAAHHILTYHRRLNHVDPCTQAEILGDQELSID